MTVKESESHYSIGEVEAQIADMGEADYAKVILLIEQLNPHRAGCTGEDLYERAIQKMLIGERQWPRHVKRATFIRNVVRSLISSEIKKNKDALSMASGMDDIESVSDLVLEDSLQNDQQKISAAVHELMDTFEGDGSIRCILLNKLKSYQASKIKEVCKLTEQSYQAAMRRLKRNARQLFPEGIDYWRGNG